MSQYVLKSSNFQSGQVGSLYNIGLSDGTNQYGYVFQNIGPEGGIREETNITDKDKLIQYSSPNLIDRDLAFYPRVTQGDESGGGLQIVFIDPTKYFDSDLEIRTPGYLTLRPGWVRTQLTTGLGAVTPQSVAWNNDVYTTFGGTSYYNSAGTAFSSAGITVKFIETDGNVLFVGDGVNTIKYTLNNSTWTTLLSTIGVFNQMWAIYRGTNGRFVYVTASSGNAINNASDNLAIIDVNSPALVSVATGGTHFNIVDIVGYQNGIAILANDPGGTGFDVWYHDGVNMTRIVRVNQYTATGICPCLGDLYVTGQSTGQFEAPVLMRISAGNFEIVVRTSSPIATLTNAGVGAPVSAGQYVCFALTNPAINYVTTTSYIGVYDVISGAYSHLGSRDALDAPAISSVRQIAFSGRAVTFPMSSAGTGFLQSQTNSSRMPAGNTFVSSGTFVSSKLDFGTPGIPKRFRRIEAVHAPLAAGESIALTAFVDGDQLHLGSTSQIGPTTNSTVGTTSTVLTMGADTVGRQMYYTAKLAGNGSTTPDVNRIAVEIGGTYTWPLELDCTNQRRLLNQATVDPQGITGKDLYYLLRNSYENGNLLTLFLAENVSYTVTIESLKAHNPAYVDHQGSPVKADEEWLVSAVLKQVA